MQTINFAKGLSFEQIALFIATCPEIRVHVEGEPGIGKSSMLPIIARHAGIKRWAYIDTPSLDVGDARMPVLKHDTKTTGFYPNEWFQLHTGEPVIIMLDEFPKAPQATQNMLHPLLEETNPRFGDIPLPPGSIVFSTGNLTTDGVGDNTKAHTIGRQTRVRMRKSTNEEWIRNYAVNAGIDGAIIAWAHETPQAFASYLDEGTSENHMIFNPRRVGKSFCSPRSLSRCNTIVKQREIIGMETMTAGLIGTIGEQAARELGTFIEYHRDLPKWADIIANPKTTKLPTSPPATSVLVFNAVTRIDEETINPFIDYLERLDTGWQATFMMTLAKSEKQKIGFRNARFAKWVSDNADLL